jgi:Fur family peroxide stress response transcriptional regulator
MVLAAIHELEHPTAQETYTHIAGVARSDDRISLGTVYRNLQVLEQEGKIISVPAGQNAMHYDDRLDIHYHLLCRKCGRITDVPVEYNNSFDLIVEERSGCKIESHGILFKGICKDCS